MEIDNHSSEIRNGFKKATSSLPRKEDREQKKKSKDAIEKITRLEKKIDEKNDRIRSLKKEVKTFNSVLTDKQKNHESALTKERQVESDLRRKVKSLKKIQSASSDQIKLVKKQYEEKVVLMKKKITDYEERIKKANNDRFEWEMTKNKCEEDLKILLEDYFQRGNLLEAAETKVEKYKERMSEEQKKLNVLKDLYDTMEQKCQDIQSEKRVQDIRMAEKLKLLESENEKLKNSLLENDAKYEKLLLSGQNKDITMSCNVTEDDVVEHPKDGGLYMVTSFGHSAASKDIAGNEKSESVVASTPVDATKINATREEYSCEDKKHIPSVKNLSKAHSVPPVKENVNIGNANILPFQKPAKPSNLKRKLNSLSKTKKSVSFKSEVDLQYFDGENAPMTSNKEYITILKPPQDKSATSESSNVSETPSKPIRKVYKNIPEFHPIKSTPPRRLPKLQSFPPPKSLCSVQPQEKISASDIFGPCKQDFEDIDIPKMFHSDNLYEAMDFLLTM
ncbi:myosin heavy chain, clone 203-like [Clytia hemisphaerica]|uniref:myosin heavy chain, clone 203-like n=1 Tax=Clytia hemisphaerica TaxID=252671 RepID=UPI0034D6935C